MPMFPFYTPKITRKPKFSDVFRGYRKGGMARNELKPKLLLKINSNCLDFQELVIASFREHLLTVAPVNKAPTIICLLQKNRCRVHKFKIVLKCLFYTHFKFSVVTS